MSHGAEVELRGQIGSHFSFTGAYTYTSTRIQEAPPCEPPYCDPLIYGVGAPLLRRPKHAGTAAVHLHALALRRDRWRGGGGPASRLRLPLRIHSAHLLRCGYARVDLGGWYNITRHITAYANVGNALNNHYNEVLGYPALKANFRAGLRFRLGGKE